MKNGWQTKSSAKLLPRYEAAKVEARERVNPEALVSFVPMEDFGIDRKILTTDTG